MTMDARGFYDELGDDYDLMVSWEERLAREEPFFRKVFADHGAESVLDAACGTGMHAVAFARWGLRAAAADLSPAMVERARRHAAAAGVEVEVREAAFGALAAAFAAKAGSLDAVTCLGNSLPHLPDDATLVAALADMGGLLRPGGVLVVQDRNYDRVLRERARFMPITARGDAAGETLFVRLTDFHGGDRLAFTILTLRRQGGEWTCSARTTPLRGITRETLDRALAGAGFSRVDWYGGYGFTEFDAPGTADLVAVAEK